jgi:hypothetical protein
MKSLNNGLALHVILSLTLAVGLVEPIVLLQLHFYSLVTLLIYEEEKRVYKTYEKFYRIECSTLYELTMQNATSVNEAYTEEVGQIALTRQGNLPLAITKEVKRIKKRSCRAHARHCIYNSLFKQKTTAFHGLVNVSVRQPILIPALVWCTGKLDSKKAYFA